MLNKLRRRMERKGGKGVQELTRETYQHKLSLNPQSKSKLSQRKVLSNFARLTQLEEIDSRYWSSEGSEELEWDETESETDIYHH